MPGSLAAREASALARKTTVTIRNRIETYLAGLRLLSFVSLRVPCATFRSLLSNHREVFRRSYEPTSPQLSFCLAVLSERNQCHRSFRRWPSCPHTQNIFPHRDRRAGRRAPLLSRERDPGPRT